jgi:hypothetical protein
VRVSVVAILIAAAVIVVVIGRSPEPSCTTSTSGACFERCGENGAAT